MLIEVLLVAVGVLWLGELSLSGPCASLLDAATDSG